MSVKRKWNEQHRAAGYHEQTWETASDRSALIGSYDCELMGQAVVVHVRHLAAGPTGGPEFEIDWEGFHSVTVLDEATVLEYLINCGAAKVEG